MACAEGLLGIENNVEITVQQRRRLPTGSNYQTAPDPERLDRLRPLTIPVLMRQIPDMDSPAALPGGIELIQRRADLSQPVSAPMIPRPIEMGHPLILPCAPHMRITQQPEQFSGINRTVNTHVDPFLHHRFSLTIN